MNDERGARIGTALPAAGGTGPLEQRSLALGVAESPAARPTTDEQYRVDMAAFAAWCAVRGVTALPATPATVVTYARSLRSSGRKPATVLRALSSIAAAHRDAGAPLPKTSDAIARYRSELRGERDAATSPTLAVITAGVRAAIAVMDERRQALHDPRRITADVRDRALLLVAYAGALKLGELRSMTFENVAPVDAGALLRVCGSRNAKRARDVEIPLGRFASTCPVRALDDWLRVVAATGRTEGAIWVGIDPAGAPTAKPLVDDRLALVIERRLAAAGIAPERLRGHSLRAGALAQLALEDASDGVILKHGGYHPESLGGIVPLLDRARDLKPIAGRLLGL